MKIPTLRTLLSVGFCTLLFGCDPIDTTQHGKLPETMGPITFGSSRIGAGQAVMASAPLPVGGENINTVDYYWAFTETGLHHDSFRTADGVAYYQFLAPTTPGSYNLIFGGNYLFVGPDAQGEMHAQKSTTQTYTVVACDAITSFWGDSMEETLRVVPSAKKDGPDICWTSFPNWISTSSSGSSSSTNYANNNQRDYMFTNGILTQIREHCLIAYDEQPTPDKALSLAYRYLVREQPYIKSLYGVEPVAIQIFDVATKTTTPLDVDKITAKDEAYTTPLGTRLLLKEIHLTLSYSWGKTNLNTSVWFTSPDNSMILRQYSPKS